MNARLKLILTRLYFNFFQLYIFYREVSLTIVRRNSESERYNASTSEAELVKFAVAEM